MNNLSSTHLKTFTLGQDTYDIASKYIQSVDSGDKTFEDIKQLIEAAKLPIKVVEVLPQASAQTMGAIYLVPKVKTETKSIYDEYVTVESSTTPKTYSWEHIGSTDIDLQDYLKKGNTYTNAAQSSGGHSHTVSGNVTVPTVTATSKHISASASGTKVGVKSTAQVLTGVKVSADDTVLGANTTFAVSGGQLTGATQASKAADTFTANTPTRIDTTKFYGGSITNGSVTGGQYTGATQASFTQGSKASYTQGSKAAWSAAVDANGVLSFSFTTNGDDTFITNGNDSFTANNIGQVSPIVYTAPTLTPAELQAGFYTAGSSASFTEGVFTPNSIGSVSPIGVTSNADDRVQAATAVSGDGTSTVATDVEVITQPTITLDGEAASGVSYVGAVSVGSTTAALNDGAAATTGAHTHDLLVSIT